MTASIQHFNGPISAKTGKLASLEIIPALIARSTATGTVAYLEPGEVHATPGVHSLRAHVLGPSRKPSRLTKSAPSSGVAKETYLAGDFALALEERYAAAASLDDALDTDESYAFALQYCIPAEEVTGATRDATRQWLWDRYFAPGEAWRNVDLAWLSAAGPLALKLDNDTNNTSLVLALELEPGGDVLLFAADAQVGNWLSWHDQNYPPPRMGQPDVTACDLLERTILYKVGHHASHNATLDERGLALMTHPGLVVMIPVVEAEARRTKDGKAVHRGWNMPHQELLARLMDRTSGRILRGDAEPGRDPKGEIFCGDAGFLDRVTANELFVEYVVADFCSTSPSPAR